MRAAAARASGTGAGVWQEIRGRAELVEGLAGGGLDGASITMTLGLMRPWESRTCCD